MPRTKCPKKTELERRIDRLTAWVNSLTDLDRMNLTVLTDLPNARGLLEGMAPGDYRDNALLLLELKDKGLLANATFEEDDDA